jgi:uncharacterized membrane protein YphA (DoxX/SURF4 family)
MAALGKMLFLSPWSYRLIRIGVGLVFVWAGALKLVDPRAFARVISEYGLVPDDLLVFVALGLPAAEFLAGVGLVFDVKGSLAAIFGLVVLFLGVLGFGLLSNLDIDCGCFSPREIRSRDSLRIAFFRDLWLMCGVVYLFAWRRTRVLVRRS